MLSTAIYNADLNRIVENGRSALARNDETQIERGMRHLMKLIEYASAHGLILSQRGGRFVFVRNGYSPEFLHIDVE